MPTLRHFGDQLFYYYIEHSTSGEAQKIRQCRNDELCCNNRQHCSDRLYHTGKNTAEKRFTLAFSLRSERHGDDRALGKILNGDTEGQCKRACRRDLRVSCEEARVHHADSHSLRDIM